MEFLKYLFLVKSGNFLFFLMIKQLKKKYEEENNKFYER